MRYTGGTSCTPALPSAVERELKQLREKNWRVDRVDADLTVDKATRRDELEKRARSRRVRLASHGSRPAVVRGTHIAFRISEVEPTSRTKSPVMISAPCCAPGGWAGYYSEYTYR
jgi:hypothetical protein